MWPFACALFTVAHAQEPLPTTGQLEIEVYSQDTSSWAMQMWERTVSRLERQWRRAQRRSDEPVAEPELPEAPEEALPVPGVALQLSGESLIGGKQERVSDANGEALFTELPPGLYRVFASKGGFLGVTVELQVGVGKATLLRIPLEMGAQEDIVVTSTGR